jgi:hypothetical protein
MGKLKPHIVTMVETGMNVIRSEAYASVIQNAFETHGMFKEIRGPIKDLLCAITCSKYYQRGLLKRIVNRQRAVEGQNYQS